MSYVQDQNQLHWSQTEIQTGDTISGTTSETIFASKPQVFSANSFHIGDVIRFQASGTFSTQTLNVSTFTFRAKLGSVDILTTAGVSVGVSVLSNSVWQFSGEIHCRSVGASGTMEGFATISLSTSTSASSSQLLGMTTPVTIDTTVDQQFQISSQLSISAGANAITMRRCMTEYLLA